MVQPPQKLCVHISMDGEPLPGMFALATIETNFKGSFSVVIGPTDAGGNACLSREEMLEQTESGGRLLVMDYGHPEASATGRIVIQLMLLPDIERALQAYTLFHPHYRYPEGYEHNLNRAAHSLQRIDRTLPSLTGHSESEPADRCRGGRTTQSDARAALPRLPKPRPAPLRVGRKRKTPYLLCGRDLLWR